MKLGEIKAQAMQLMYADRDVFCENVDELRYDPNYGQLYAGMTGAINRCLADLEARRFLPLGRMELVGGVDVGREHRFLYDGADVFDIERLSKEDASGVMDNHPFVTEAEGELRVPAYDGAASYYLLYHKKLKRVTDGSEPDKEIELPDALAEAVPFFVKGEVFAVDEPGEAGEARNIYEAAVARYADARPARTQGTVAAVYGVW